MTIIKKIRFAFFILLIGASIPLWAESVSVLTLSERILAASNYDEDQEVLEPFRKIVLKELNNRTILYPVVKISPLFFDPAQLDLTHELTPTSQAYNESAGKRKCHPWCSEARFSLASRCLLCSSVVCKDCPWCYGNDGKGFKCPSTLWSCFGDTGSECFLDCCARKTDSCSSNLFPRCYAHTQDCDCYQHPDQCPDFCRDSVFCGSPVCCPTHTDTLTPVLHPTQTFSLPKLSGIMVMPDPTQISNPSTTFPLIVLGHDTETNSKLAPFAAVGKSPRITFIVAQAELLAAMGYIVLVPDYPSLSPNAVEDRAIEPYLAPQIVETILGIVHHVLDPNSADTIRPYWSGGIAFMGYGYGGYALMRTASVIDNTQGHPFKSKLKAVIGLNSFYSISEAFIHDFMTPQQACEKSDPSCTNAMDIHSLPGSVFALWVDAYQHYQGWKYGLDEAILPANTGWSTQHLRDLLHSGTASLGEIDAYIQSHPNYQAGQGPRSITTDKFQTFLRKKRLSLKTNDAYHLWPAHQPSQTSIFLVYHPHDEIVTQKHVKAVEERKIHAQAIPLPSIPCPQEKIGIHYCPIIMNEAYQTGIGLLNQLFE